MKNILYGIIWLIIPLTTLAQSSVDRNKVMEYLQEQQYDEAIIYLRLNVDPGNPKQLALLGYTLYQSGKINEAADTYEKVLLLDSTHIPALQSLATIRSQQELYPQAQMLYLRLVKLRPQHAPSWKLLSFAAFNASQPDSGFVWLQTAYRLNPMDYRVVARLAEEWIDKQNFELADSIANAYLTRDSVQTTVLMVAAKTAFLNKAYERTIDLGARLRALHLISPNTFSYVTVACYILKKYEDCLDIYEYMRAGNAASENITYYAALGAAALKRYQQSNDLLQLCITMAKSSTLEGYYNSTAANYESMGQYKTAMAYLDTSYYLAKRPLRQYSIGRIYETALHNETTAMKYYKRYLQLYKPGTREENQIYQYLKNRTIAR